MSQQNPNNGSNSIIPVSEVYWSLVDKADKKFSKIRDLPYYERDRYDLHFCKVFKVYTQLWKFQQENRQKLVEAGVKRWEIGEIASRIARLYFGQYMRTSMASYLSESYIFYEAILTREYFKEGLFQDLSVANKQLRFLARFLMVCLVYNRREMVHRLVNQLKILVDECKRTFQETDFREWKLVVLEIVKFLKDDTSFMNIRPLRYSLILDPHPDSLPHVAISVAKRSLRLRDAIVSSYHHNEVKFSELTLDTFRMLQCLEWEPCGSFYQSSVAKTGHSGVPGTSCVNYMQDISDPTLPPNPRKAVLYRPSVTHLIAVMATICEELPPDGVFLVYFSASGNIASPAAGQNKENCTNNQSACLEFGTRGSGGSNCIYPCDLLPFTRRPLFIIIDSDNSEAFGAISGAEKGEPAAMLLSPSSAPLAASTDSSCHSSGSLFTIFLTAPLQAFCLLVGFLGPDVDVDAFSKAEKLLSSSLNDWGVTLATSDTLHLAWAQILSDPFLRRLLLRFLFCWTVLTLYAPTYNKKEFLPKCIPSLPSSVMPMTTASQLVVLQIADIFGVTNRFIFQEGIVLSENTSIDMES